MQTGFEWPTPPGYHLVGEAAAPDAFSCIVKRTDGRSVSGTLESMSAEHALVAFRLPGQDRPLYIPFQETKSLQLTTPIDLAQDRSVIGEEGEEVFTPGKFQEFQVEYTDGDRLSGHTRSFFKTDYGLFLFPLNPGGRALRCFIPAAVIRSWNIGRPIGDMLVAENAATPEQIRKALERQQALRAQRLGDYLTANEIVTPQQLATALERQKAIPMKRLGEVLLNMGLVTEEELSQALSQQRQESSTRLADVLVNITEDQISDALIEQRRQRATPLGQILVEMGVVDEGTLRDVLARKLGIPVVNLAKFKIDPGAVAMVDAAFARAHCLIPIQRTPDGLVVATDNPLEQGAFDRLRFLTQQQIVPVLANHSEIQAALDRIHGPSHGAPDGLRRAAETTSIRDLAGKLSAEPVREERMEEVAASDNVLVRLVNKMIEDAHAQRVSDIHIECNSGRGTTQVRFRRDGILTPYLDVPANFRAALVTRIKVMADLDISVHRRPQDGRIDFRRFGAAPVELRVVVIPTARGLEDIVMRLLTAARPIPIEQLGMPAEVLERVRELVSKPFGLFLVCGPTGSGKTTTLHSVLAMLNTPGRKIWTAEDPIEIAQPGLRQIQIQAATGWTFAAALRSLLRADPDVIMVGEMRDAETAKMAIEASLTGHLVFSTLHTNSAAESVVRLLDLGMDPFNFSDALLGVLAQRLARKLCDACKTAYPPSEEDLAALASEYCFGTDLDPAAVANQWRRPGERSGMRLYRAKGCPKCGNLGYSGRVSLQELLEGSRAIRRLVQSRSPAEAIAAQAHAEGMLTLKQDGIAKVLAGVTDMAQVRAVCG